MEVRGIITRLRERGAFHIVELTAELLRLCRGRGAELRASRIDPRWATTFRQLRRGVADVVRDRGQLDGEDAHRLAGLVAGHGAASPPDVLVARAIAEGLDDGAGQFFADWFYGQELDLEPGDPFPVADSKMRSWVPSSTGAPSVRTEPLDRLPRLRLAPSDLRGLRVSMRWADAQLAELEHVERFGIGIPCGPDVFETFTWQRYSIDAQHLFFHVRPRDEAWLEANVRTVLELAARRGVGLLVLPELCLTEAMYARLVSSRAFCAVPFVVPGSHHAPSGVGPGHNETGLLVRGKPIVAHRKFRPVLFPDRLDDDGNRRDVTRQEHLAVDESRLSICVSGDWSVATLICKDVMDNAVQDLLRDLAVQLVLVPAMSPKVEDFADLAQQLGRDPQGVTLVANVGETVAVVGVPAVKNRVISVPHGAGSLWVFDRAGQIVIE
ncbi:MAG TPA: hypothetical protein VN253_17050 [Kofleriaceae bacterium]|nr:hypothetical protein [Kofleriaceae bacterium]